ncbi:anti-sigma regulatory factor [Ancylomarina euxinus]|uniref:Anti-sigma regulatory factor n=1 Tax=Ancylomarina euxinus TaxID=2283627 RepID=A0A425Y6L1_9BACT|nr:anti-sigma regulatory factor [Ancylomarina euxinus]MCZ4693979.1 anti-sigma regulatory factor [Ancylomarina euxinus]MUP14600.1 anti-sigma regulatory factor [Ancylomarina euxinus]RRG24147.1 anti-sigma regulatory factor [Ancylomarina euxinus]
MDFKFDIEGGNFSNAGTASSDVKKVLKKLNVDPKLIKRIVVSIYEAEVNVVAHAYEGEMNVSIFPDKIIVRIVDKGPGIADIELAMQKGYSTASPEVREMGFGAGMGLPNIKKNTNELNIKSTVGVGTEVELINYLN